MREFIGIAKALADENRARTLMFLERGELCVCQIIEMLGLAPSTVSKHLSILHQAGLVESRKQGRWIYYRQTDAPSPCAAAALDWANNCLGRDRRVRADRKQLRPVRKADLKELCECYKGRG